ncbi:hypothetical protein LINPERHAP1_LOCUS4811, partial [Linum perenne]
SADSPLSLFLLLSSLFSPFSLFPSSSSPDPSSSLLSPKEGNQKQNKPFRPLPQGAIAVAAAAASRHCRRRFVSLPPPIRLIAAADPLLVTVYHRRSVARHRVPPPSRHRRAFAVAAADEALIHRCR